MLCNLFFRLPAVPIFPLEFVEPREDIANAGARKPYLGLRASVRDVFPRLDELKRKNKDCSQSIFSFVEVHISNGISMEFVHKTLEVKKDSKWICCVYFFKVLTNVITKLHVWILLVLAANH